MKLLNFTKIKKIKILQKKNTNKKILHNNSMDKNDVHIQIFGGNKMEGNQKIYCSVKNCKYNEQVQNSCTLQAINVEPTTNLKDTKKPDESMCASYEYEKE